MPHYKDPLAPKTQPQGGIHDGELRAVHRKAVQKIEYWNKHKKRASYDDKEMIEELLEVMAMVSLPYIEIHKMYPHFPTEMGIYKWRQKYPEFDAAWTDAKRCCAESHLSEIMIIADDKSNDIIVDADGGEHGNTAAISRAKLQIEARKWFATKLLAQFKEKSTIDTNVNISQEDALKALE